VGFSAVTVLAAASAAAGAAGAQTTWLDRMNWAWWTLLAALAALTAGLLVLRTVGYRRLSRLWQCVAVSLLTHVALTAGMSLVAISQPVLTLLTQPEPDTTSVNLVVGHEAQLRTQVRYQLTELPVADPSLAALMRAAVEAIEAPPFELTELAAPLAEPQRTELTAEPELASTPPAVDDRVLVRPPESEAHEPAMVESAHRPVARPEPRAQASADRPVRVRTARPPKTDPDAAWRATAVTVPAAELEARSIAVAASRVLSPLPTSAEEPVIVREEAEQPSIEVPPSAAPVYGPDHRPLPIETAPRRRLERRPLTAAAPDRPAELTAANDMPPVELAANSIAVAAASDDSSFPQVPLVPLPVRAAADRPTVELSRPSSPVAEEDPWPVSSDVSTAASLARQTVGEVGLRSSPASVPSPQRVPPADPLGASLSSHLAAALLPPVADDALLQRVRVRAALTPLGLLQPQRLRIPRPIKHRTPDRRKELVRKMGGSRISEAAVTHGLAYLARNQEPDGRWTFIDEENELSEKRPANKDDMGLTGLAVLCFLAADEHPGKPGPYQQAVTDGLAYLLARQKSDGDLRGEGDMYSHGIATLAMGEAAVMSRDPKYGEPAVKGARFIVAAQNRLTGGWRYVPGSGGDTSVLGWQIMALYSVSRMGIDIPPETRKGALRWLSSVSRGRQRMLVGYQDANPTRTMTSEGLFVRLLLGEKPTDAQIAEIIAYVKPPDPMEPPNFYGWYYGSLAMMQLQNDAWRKWNPSVRDRLTATQQQGGRLDGSWDPSQSRWGAERGGRIYATAIATLTLEVYYRYLPMLAREAPGEKPASP
jgi:hypothetical protein